MHDSLENLYKTNFALMQHHIYSLTEFVNMMPWERDVYVNLLLAHIAEEERRQKQEENRISIKPRVLMLEWTDPPWYAGHWVPEQVIAAGGVCLFGLAGKESRPISWNQIKDSNPDIIIGCACGFDTQQNYNQLSELVDLGHLNGLTALKQNKIWAVDANSYFSRPSPRLSKGSKILEQIFTRSTDRLNHSDALHLDLSTYQRKV